MKLRVDAPKLFISLITTVVCVYFGGWIGAQESTDRHVPVLLEVTRPSGMVVYQGFGEVISSVVRLESQKAGFIFMEPQKEFVEETTIEEILSTAEEKGAHFVVHNGYLVTREAIELISNCYYVPSRELIETREVKERIGLDVDAAIEEALSEVFDTMKRKAEQIPAQVLAASGEVPVAKPVLQSVPSPSDGSASGFGGETGSAGSAVTDADGGYDRTSARKHFEIGGGFYPFVPLGTAGEYMQIGYLPYLNLGFPIDIKIGYLTLGVMGAAHIFRAEGYLAAADNYLVPVGGMINLAILLTRVVGFTFGVAGGPTFFIVVPDPETGLETMWKLVPFVKGDFGLGLIFGGTFGVTVNVGITAFFEESIKIFGFTPGMGLVLRI